jgi:hypothetical protein
MAQGYNFIFFTHLVETNEGQKWSYCFEYGYREGGDGFLDLKMNSSYLEAFMAEEE